MVIEGTATAGAADRPAMSNARDPRAARTELAQRIFDRWLPDYLADYAREPGGYRGGEERVSEFDARWFLRAIDDGIVEQLPKARMRLPASRLKAMIFWSGSTRVSPRPVSLHLEGILSAGMAARLHFEFGWPIERLGFEVPPDQPVGGRRAFDIGAFDGSTELGLAGEAKKAKGELDHLLAVLRSCGARGAHEHEDHERAVNNGHRKWLGLIRCTPRAFFTFGPDDDVSVYQVLHRADGMVTLEAGDRELLHFG